MGQSMPANFDQRSFRNACGMFATGVTVVTAGRPPAFHGMTANAFSSLSLDPPLVLICVDKKTHMLEVLQETPAFTVNILGVQQEALSTYFASSDRVYGPEEFKDLKYSIGETGAPRLDDAICYMDCVVRDIAIGGDHDIYIGEVKAFETRHDTPPLLFYGGRYHRLPESPAAG